jgi:hypothetical protein
VVALAEYLERPEFQNDLATGFGGRHSRANVLYGLEREMLFYFLA